MLGQRDPLNYPSASNDRGSTTTGEGPEAEGAVLNLVELRRLI